MPRNPRELISYIATIPRVLRITSTTQVGKYQGLSFLLTSSYLIFLVIVFSRFVLHVPTFKNLNMKFFCNIKKFCIKSLLNWQINLRTLLEMLPLHDWKLSYISYLNVMKVCTWNFIKFYEKYITFHKVLYIKFHVHVHKYTFQLQIH